MQRNRNGERSENRMADRMRAQREALPCDGQHPTPTTNTVNLDQALEHAAEHLPQGWTIHVSVENGAGWVRAERPDGTMVEMHEDETDFVEQVSNAVRLAHDEIAAESLIQCGQPADNDAAGPSPETT